MSVSLKYYNDQYPVSRQNPHLQFVSICRLRKPSLFAILSLLLHTLPPSRRILRTIILFALQISHTHHTHTSHTHTHTHNVKVSKYDIKIRVEQRYKRYEKQTMRDSRMAYGVCQKNFTGFRTFRKK